jgi:Ser-tRNA(Ala) deacylase AlaX
MAASTELKYLTDTHLFNDTGVVLSLGRDERGSYVVLNQSIFYPQGGGQPSDKGSIRFDQVVLDVFFVAFKNGEVFHYVTEEPMCFDALVGMTGELCLDATRRIKHAKLHTAGHLIAGIIDSWQGGMRATKGFHFEEGPYVEFEGEPETDVDTVVLTLQQKIDQLILEDQSVTASLVSHDEIIRQCQSVPANLPQDKPMRFVKIHPLEPVPCGGTHVRNLSELGKVSILKLKKRKGTTKISYCVESLP